MDANAKYCIHCGKEFTEPQWDWSEEWLEFDYWDYVIGQVRNNRELWTVLNCARAFTDDDDMIYIIVGETRLSTVAENSMSIRAIPGSVHTADRKQYILRKAF